MAKNKSYKKKMYSFPKHQVVTFGVLFGLMGAVMAWSAFAQTPIGKGNNASVAVCNLPSETKLGSYYTGTIDGIAQTDVINAYVTFGDGTQRAWPYGWSDPINLQYMDMGNWDGTGSKATVLGTTQVKIAGLEKRSAKTQKVYAVCTTNVVN
jgi:hypothetical protein